MWKSRCEILAHDRIIRVAVDLAEAPVSYQDVIHLWQHDVDFRSFFINLLAASPFPCFRWETPPLTAAIATQPFECVFLNSPGLDRVPDVAAFSQYFRDEVPGGVVEFPNLGKDAILVVPCPQGPLSAYGHIGAFIRHAPPTQQHVLWQKVGAAMQRRLGKQPVWLSTAGGGVSWLHVRLDDRPKYYGYVPYRAIAPSIRPRAT